MMFSCPLYKDRQQYLVYQGYLDPQVTTEFPVVAVYLEYREYREHLLPDKITIFVKILYSILKNSQIQLAKLLCQK